MVLEELQASSLHKNRVEFHYSLNGHGFRHATSILVKSGMVKGGQKHFTQPSACSSKLRSHSKLVWAWQDQSLPYWGLWPLFYILKINLSNFKKVQSTIEIYNWSVALILTSDMRPVSSANQRPVLRILHSLVWRWTCDLSFCTVLSSN